MVEVGNWMRNKETGEAVKVTGIGAFIDYEGDGIDGQVNPATLSSCFDVIVDPTLREDIEFLVKAKVAAGDAEFGLYAFDLAYLAVIDGQDGIELHWFEHTISAVDVLN